MMPLLEVKNLKVHFPVKRGMFSRVREFCESNGIFASRVRAFADGFISTILPQSAPR
jgi:hypothetical protein